MDFRTIACVAGATILSAGVASAATYDQTEIQNLTETGQDLFFGFDDLPTASGPATITIASGGSLFIAGLDLSGADPLSDEYFEATVDGMSLGLYSCGGSAGVGAIVIPGTEGTNPVFDCEFSLPISLTQDMTDLVLADGMATISVLFGTGVEDFLEMDEVVVSLSYQTVAPVPLPASLPLLVASLGAVGVIGRRRARAGGR